MNKVLAIRKRLGLSQHGLASCIGKTQGVISNVEVGRQDLMPEDARRIILYAMSVGIELTFDDIYECSDRSGQDGQTNEEFA